MRRIRPNYQTPGRIPRILEKIIGAWRAWKAPIRLLLMLVPKNAACGRTFQSD